MGRILRLAVPSIATFSSMTFTGMLTLIIIGRLGAVAIAVVGISNILLYNTWALFAGVNESINYLVSQNFGEGTMEEGNRRMQIALVLTLLLDALWVLASLTLPAHILHWIGARPNVVQAGTVYLRIRMLSFAFSMFTNVFFGYMRAVGDTRTPMVISLVTNSLLIVLTYVLTYGVALWGHTVGGMGLAGAAVGMVITEGLGFLLCLVVHYRSYAKRFQTRTWHPMAWPAVRFICRESVKLSLTELSMSVGMLVFTACIARLGTAAVAANEIALNILSLGFMPANGFGAAATIVVGQAIGAKKIASARRSGLYTLYLGLGFMALFSVFLWLFALPVAKIYTADPKVYLLAITLIHLASFLQLFDGGGIIMAGALRGLGDTSFLSRVSMILNWGIFVPMTLVLTDVFHAGQIGAWVALYTLIVLTGIANGWRFLAIPVFQMLPQPMSVPKEVES